MQCIHNVIAVNIGIETERQTVNTQIRLLLRDASGSFTCPDSKPHCSNVRIITAMI